MKTLTITFVAVLGFLCMGLGPVHKEACIAETNEKDTIYIERNTTVFINVCDMYSTAVNYLKRSEGFSSVIYLDTDGKETIGYGHHLLEGEKYTHVSEEYATKILKKDLDKHIRFVERETSLTGNQSLAIALLSYNVGHGKCRKYIKNGLLQSKNLSKILLYCHYKTVRDGETVIVYSHALKKRREFERYIYCYEL